MSTYTGQIEIINVGVLPNDGEGDPLRTAFQKVNNNFSILFGTAFLTSNTATSGSTAGQPILEIPLTDFDHGIFEIKSSSAVPNSPDSQFITLSAQLTNDAEDVKFVGYSTTFSGNCITNYDMDVYGSNVRILVNPLLNIGMHHSITSQIIGAIFLQLDGYTFNTVLATEDGALIKTEAI